MDASATPATATANGPAALALQQYALLQVQAALSSMPAGSAVQQAQTKAPHLVSRESDPYRFLLSCHPMNPSKAAQKLAAYWEMRLSILGSSRAFQEFSSLNQLSQNAREILQTGLCVLLENDALGRPVLCLDFSRRLEPFSMEGYMEAAFYSGTLMMQKLQDSSPNNLQSSFVILFLEADSDTVEKDSTHQFLSVLSSGGFPAALHSCHIFTSAPKALQGQEQQMQSSVRDIMSSFSYISKKHPTYIHDTSDKERLCTVLHSHALRRDGIPHSLGGTWKYESFLAQLCGCDCTAAPQDNRTSNIHSSEGHLKPSAALVLQPSALAPSEEAKNPSAATAATVRDTIYSAARLQFAKAVNQIPPENRVAYTQATTETENDPELWDKECNLDAFLKSEDLHAKLAAQRMASYWKLRSESFGQNKYKRLFQTGEDAMERRELTALGTGFIKLLHSDGDGHPVLFIDGSHLTTSVLDATRDRCLFYMFSLACENPMAQSDGIVLILKIDTAAQRQTIDRQYLAKLVQSLPIRLCSVHVLSHSPLEGHELSPLKGLSIERLHVHVATNTDTIVARLERFGLTKKHLPKTLNGEWSYAKFVQWQELRTRMEWRIPLGFRGRDNAESFDFPAIRPYKVLPETERAESKRRSNVIHCRRKRDRVRIETRDLEEHVAELQVEQQALRREALRLEDLLENAQRMIGNAAVSAGSRDINEDDDRRTTMEGGVVPRRCLNHEPRPPSLQAHRYPASDTGTVLPFSVSSGSLLSHRFDPSAQLMAEFRQTEISPSRSQLLQLLAPLDEPISLDRLLLYRLHQQQQQQELMLGTTLGLQQSSLLLPYPQQQSQSTTAAPGTTGRTNLS